MQLGVIGLGTMGANLARNAARNGAEVAVFNRTTKVTNQFIKTHGKEGKFTACKTYENLVSALKAPRAILVMVKAGEATDAVRKDLVPLLDKGDIIIDGGNSHFPDTERRCNELKEKGINFIGMGISGGEVGALEGPSMMPGGDLKAYKQLEPLFKLMAADDGSGGKCISYMGDGGAGHFVKMVHNGIEYGVMQVIAESYDILRTLGNFSNEKFAQIYDSWNQAENLESYLMEITAKIFTKKAKDKDLIDLIADRAGQKGTGKWTTQAALDFGVPIPTINAAVDARIISGSVDLRTRMKDFPHQLDEHDPIPPPEKFASLVRSAVEQSIICVYLQGFTLIRKASDENKWKINLGEIARIWKRGCIISSSLLEKLERTFGRKESEVKAAKEELLERFKGERQLDWRRVLERGISHGVPLPAISASVSYYDALKKESLPQNLIQAQRDYFGSHTFERTDKGGSFHADWPT